MPQICRISDLGTGPCCHSSHNGCVTKTGFIVTGASTSQVESGQIARVGDVVIGFCGHSGIIVGGSGNVSAEGSGLARVGDPFAGTFSGVLITGAATTTSG